MKKFYFLLILGLVLVASVSPAGSTKDGEAETSKEDDQADSENASQTEGEEAKKEDAPPKDKDNKIAANAEAPKETPVVTPVAIPTAVDVPVPVPVVVTTPIQTDTAVPGTPQANPNDPLAAPPHINKPKVEITINIVAQALKELEKRLYYIEDKTDHILYHNNHDVTKHTVQFTPFGPQIIPVVDNPASAHHQLKMNDVAKGSLAINNMALNQLIPQSGSGGSSPTGGVGVPGIGMPGMMGTFPGGGFGMGMGVGGFPNPGIMGAGPGMQNGVPIVKQARKLV